MRRRWPLRSHVGEEPRRLLRWKCGEGRCGLPLSRSATKPGQSVIAGECRTMTDIQAAYRFSLRRMPASFRVDASRSSPQTIDSICETLSAGSVLEASLWYFSDIWASVIGRS